MKLILSQPLFAQAIETAASVADKKIEHVADFILLTVKDGVLTVIGTDMERESKTCVTLDQESEDGIALVSGKKLKDLVKSAPNDSVVTFKSNPKEPDAFTMTFSGTRSRFTLRGKDATMFPSIDMDGNQKTLSVDRVQFVRALDAMSKFMADQTIQIATTANHIVLTLGSNTYISKLIDGKFPDAERVIPRKNQVVYRANRSLLIGSLTRAAILANEKFKGIRMNFTGNELSIEANNPEQDAANEVVDIESVTQGNVEIGFNVKYVIDALQMYTDENVLIELQDGNSSALIRTEAANDHIAVLMPMRL